MRSILFSAAVSFAVFTQAGCAQEAPALDREQLLEDLRILAADDMEGREVATEGNARARAYIIERLEGIGAGPVNGDYEHSFTFSLPRNPDEDITGVNILAQIEGTSDSARTLVVTAHYDHEGMRDGQIWNGADDNASGVASVLAIAADFVANPPEHDVIFAFVDAEERGLQGAPSSSRWSKKSRRGPMSRCRWAMTSRPRSRAVTGRC